MTTRRAFAFGAAFGAALAAWVVPIAEILAARSADRHWLDIKGD